MQRKPRCRQNYMLYLYRDTGAFDFAMDMHNQVLGAGPREQVKLNNTVRSPTPGFVVLFSSNICPKSTLFTGKWGLELVLLGPVKVRYDDFI